MSSITGSGVSGHGGPDKLFMLIHILRTEVPNLGLSGGTFVTLCTPGGSLPKS